MTLQGMRVGRMDRRITLQTNMPAQDAYGEPIEAWSDIATVWASVAPKSATERFESDQEHAQAQTEFRVRWRAGIDAADRITYNGQVYDITGVIELGRREGLLITGVVKELP